MRAHVSDRQAALIALVREHGSISVRELAQRLGVHMMTVRRDLDLLADEHRVERRHGSVRLPHKAAEPARPAVDPATLTVGMIVPVRDYYFADVIRGAQAVVTERGARLILNVTSYAEAEDSTALVRLVDSGVDGILFIPTGDSTTIDAAALRALDGSDVPLVVAERCLQPSHPLAGRDWVYADHAQGVGRAVRFLVGRGRRQVIMMSRIALPGTRYLDGYLAAMKGLGLRPPVPPMEAAAPVSDSKSFIASITTVVRLVRAGRADSIIVQNDSSAIEVISALVQQGIRIPRDLAVITYDDELAELCEIPLTAVSPPKRLVGTQAAELLLDRIADARARAGDPSYPAETSRHLGLVPDLVLRRSTP